MLYVTRVPAEELTRAIGEARELAPRATITWTSGDPFPQLTVSGDGVDVCKLCEVIGYPTNVKGCPLDCDVCTEPIY